MPAMGNSVSLTVGHKLPTYPVGGQLPLEATGDGQAPRVHGPWVKVSPFHAATILMLVTLGPVTSSLQIIFRSEPSSDLLDHFATIGIVD